MKVYQSELVKQIQDEIKIIQNNGIDIIIKPSPGEERLGYLDPRELEIIKNQQSGDETVDWSTSLKDFKDVIKVMRDRMGFPNRNLNTVEIITKYEEISNDTNKFGLWRYYPRKSEKNNKRPAFIFIHGGGWIGGSVYTVENFCKLLAELADAVVFNVDYSLAPEKPYPNGLNDNYYAVKHVYDYADKYGIDPNKIGVGGDSAGGNYTAAVCLKARDEGTPRIALQVLIYPAVLVGEAKAIGYEWSETFFDISDEQKEIIKGCLMLGRPMEDQSKDLITISYLKNKEEAYHPYVSPMLAKSHSNLPRTILFGAEFDGLRVQTEYYAKLLSEAGVSVTTYRYKGMTNAFLDKLGVLPQAEDMCIEIAKVMKEL